MGKHRDRHHESDDDDIDSDDNDSDESDDDYKALSSYEINSLRDMGISEERILYLWNKQSGLCYLTNIPLEFHKHGTSLNSVVVCARKVSQTVSDTNSILVCKGASAMRDSVGLTWTQFRALLHQYSNSAE